MRRPPQPAVRDERLHALLCLIFSSFFFVSLQLVWPALSAEHDCEPGHCGDGLSIRYPFWIDRLQDPECGYPTFKLSCGDNRSLIRIYDDYFVVLSISYGNSSFVVTSADLRKEHCPIPRYSLSLDATPFTFSPANQNLSFFLNCSSEIKGRALIDCASSSERRSFVGNTSTDQYEGEAAKSCESFVAWRYTGKGALLDYAALGFILNWDAVDCHLCEVTGGSCRYNLSDKRFACVCRDRFHAISCNVSSSSLPPPKALQETRSRKARVIIGAVVGGSFLLSTMTIFFLKRQYTRWKTKDLKDVEDMLEEYSTWMPKRYKYSDVKRMTGSFSTKLGQGGFGKVYRGKLGTGNQLVAVKLLNKSDGSGTGEQFVNEVASIGRTYHINVVRLLGFCSEGKKRALIYEFMPNGSLDKFIFGEAPRDSNRWKALYEIAVGVARGMEYLHRGCKIVHFDIKPHNILLDEDFLPKISDFGLARLCRPKESVVSMSGARGTIGYIAPEVFSRAFGVISSKSDVYSYGMMLLEMVNQRRNAEITLDDATDQEYFPQLVHEQLTRGNLLGVHDITTETEEVAMKMILVGLWCIQTNPKSRPSMSSVVEMFQRCAEDIETPPKPYLSSQEHLWSDSSVSF